MLKTKVKFGELLTTLEAKGQFEQAEHYRKIVTEKLKDVLSEKEVYALSINDLIIIFGIAKKLKELYYQQPLPLQIYIEKLGRLHRELEGAVGESGLVPGVVLGV